MTSPAPLTASGLPPTPVATAGWPAASAATPACSLPADAALLLIDFQQGFDHPSWGRRNNPGAEAAAARLLEAWRAAGRPVIHVQHLAREAQSPYRPGQPGIEFKPALRPHRGEFIVQKATNSAFVDTGLEALLREQSIASLVVAGLHTNNAVEASVRMAGNLGYRVFLAADATATVDKRDLSGRLWFAEEIQALSLANLDREYATVTDSSALLAALGAASGTPGAEAPETVPDYVI